jgi:pyruvate dehydrogenase E2 component (dihydrolipoamide acetyltransferase)
VPVPAQPAAPSPALAATPVAAPPVPGRRILASPLAKTLAIELGIDLRTLGGSGPGGRIVERDVRAAASGTGTGTGTATGTIAEVGADPGPAAPSTALAVVSGAPASVPATISSDEYVDKPLSNMRKRIAERMVEVKRNVPHFYLTRDFDVAPLMAFRKRLNHLLGDRGKVSVNDLLIKGVALALRRVPDCNAAFVGDAIRYFTNVHIGVAVALDRGLITPVVRNADLKGIGVIGAEVKDLATRARDRRLKMHEIQGSTFTVSNLGMFGIDHFQAIINTPEAGILAIGTIVEKPVVVDGQLAVGKRMSLSMSCDHRVIDGALGARYLKELVDILEKPESLAL